MNTRQTLGRWGEDLAAAYLHDKGYAIVARNLRNSFGEIDLVARKMDVLVFVEVKTRSSKQFGYPEEAVDAAKLEHIIAAAEDYLQAQSAPALDWQVDVIAIRKLKSGQSPEILHFENVTR
jgi:putative endonuclease